MTTCPYCSGEVADGAVKCRHCGQWVSATNQAFRVVFVLLLIVAFIVVVIVASQPYS